MGPIDYLGAMPQQDFLRDIQGGLQLGMAYRQNQDQQQQQQLALQQAQQYKTDVAAAMANPTPQAFSALTLKYPTQREAVKQAWDGMSAADQKAEGDTMSQAYSALLAGKPDIAKQVVQSQIDARKNSGLDTSHYDNALTLLDTDPKQAQGALGFALSHISDPKTFAASFGALQEMPGKVAEADATTAGKQADNVTKNLGIVAQTAGALAKPGVKPTQAITMFKSLEARGIIPKGGAQDYIDGIPSDPKALPDYLASVRDQGIKPDDQKKFTTPDANTLANNATSVQTTGMNNKTQLSVQDRIDARAKAESDGSDDVASFTPAAIDNAAARYNLDGTLPPMGMGKAASAGRTAILNRAAEMKAGVDPEQQRRDQLGNKGQIASQNKAVQAFTSGKLGSSVRSFNVGLSHLDTLGNLADALDNKDTQAVNRIGNYFATQTGSTAPTSFNAAKKIVGDEIVKAIVGSGGGVHDREEAAKVIDGANSPAQLKAAINTYKELMVGQLGGLEQQYRTSTGMSDFERYLSPQALAIRKSHGGGASTPAPAAATPALPAGWSVQVH